jgi:hypothetical protein
MGRGSSKISSPSFQGEVSLTKSGRRGKNKAKVPFQHNFTPFTPPSKFDFVRISPLPLEKRGGAVLKVK